jgi:DtxR family Mn-dependent transcriptional regulator
MQDNKDLSSAMEDYIKTIYQLEIKNKVARVSDIGRRLDVKKASVVAAVNFFKKNELISHERYGFITLTDRGRLIAEKILKRNQALYEFLSVVLKIDPERAKDEACGMEHYISDDTAVRLKAFAKPVPERKNDNSRKMKRK